MNYSNTKQMINNTLEVKTAAGKALPRKALQALIEIMAALE